MPAALPEQLLLDDLAHLAVAFALGLDTVLLSAATTAVVCVGGTVLSIACQNEFAMGRFHGHYQLVVFPLHRFGVFSAADAA